jgi:MFS family permease
VLDDPEFRGGRGLLLAAALGIAFGVSTLGLTYSLGAFVKPLSAAFGASRKDILNVSVFVTLGVVPASLVAGSIVDRFGARRLTLLSWLGFAAVFVALGTLTTGLASLYALYLLMPILAIGTTPITYTRAITAQFERRRGFALGIALSGTGLCALVVPPYLAWVMERWGWRAAYVALAVPLLALALPAAWAWLRDPPASGAAPVPAIPAGAAAATRPVETAAIASGLEFSAALRGRRFWTLVLAFFLVSAAATGLLTNAVPMLVDRGYSSMRAASALSVFGIAVVLGRLAVGLLVDRFWAPLVGASILLPAGLGLLTLLPAETSWAWTLGVLVLTGIATGAEFDLLAFLAARYFGLRAYGRIYGALFVAFAGGAGAVGPVFGSLYERHQSYGAVLAAVAAGYIGCALLLLTLGRYPTFAPAAAHPAMASLVARRA